MEIEESGKYQDPSENETFLRSLIREEIEKALSLLPNEHVLVNAETGKMSTVLEACRRCKEVKPLSAERYCQECEDHLTAIDKKTSQKDPFYPLSQKGLP